MKIYYQDDHVTLYHGDCLEITDWLEADVLVTDPPYGMNYTGFGGRKGEPSRERGRHTVLGDDTTQIRDEVIGLWGSKPALVFGKWNVTRPLGVKQRLIWDKRPCGFMGDVSIPWGSTDEEVYVLGDGWSNGSGRTSNIVSAQTYMSRDSLRPDHPTPKPVALMEKLIEKVPDGVIADPFSGSGATLMAARNLGRKAIGVELEEKYCEITASRLSQQVFDFEGMNLHT